MGNSRTSIAIHYAEMDRSEMYYAKRFAYLVGKLVEHLHSSLEIYGKLNHKSKWEVILYKYHLYSIHRYNQQQYTYLFNIISNMIVYGGG